VVVEIAAVHPGRLALAGRLEEAWEEAAGRTGADWAWRRGWARPPGSCGGARLAEARDAVARHLAKSLLFLAAAYTAGGDRLAARTATQSALDLATICGADPLRWPALVILAQQAGDPDPLLNSAAAILRPMIDGLPGDLRAEAASRPPASWLLALGAAGGG
jgi:hypothetical protein